MATFRAAIAQPCVRLLALLPSVLERELMPDTMKLCITFYMSGHISSVPIPMHAGLRNVQLKLTKLNHAQVT